MRSDTRKAKIYRYSVHVEDQKGERLMVASGTGTHCEIIRLPDVEIMVLHKNGRKIDSYQAGRILGLDRVISDESRPVDKKKGRRV